MPCTCYSTHSRQPGSSAAAEVWWLMWWRVRRRTYRVGPAQMGGGWGWGRLQWSGKEHTHINMEAFHFYTVEMHNFYIQFTSQDTSCYHLHLSIQVYTQQDGWTVMLVVAHIRTYLTLSKTGSDCIWLIASILLRGGSEREREGEMYRETKRMAFTTESVIWPHRHQYIPTDLCHYHPTGQSPTLGYIH